MDMAQAQTLFLAVDEGDGSSVHELSKEKFLGVWLTCSKNPDDEDRDQAIEAYQIASEWPWDVPMITGGALQATKWLFELSQKGVVTDTEENTCWAVGFDKAAVEAALEQEIAKFE